MMRPPDPFYFDHAATTPLDPEVLAAMLPYLEGEFGNPSSLHDHGRRARSGVAAARHLIADSLGARDDEIIFTSSGSEANNLALKGSACFRRDKGNHIITSTIEHHSVIESCRWLERWGFDVTYLPVDGKGMVDIDDVLRAITPRTILISVMHANNEIGAIQPIVDIARLAQKAGIPFHADAVQTFGTLPLNVGASGISLLSASAHKLYGPKGIGFLYARHGHRLESLIHGGGQERHRRAGTENAPAIIGFAKATQLAFAVIDKESKRLTGLRDRLLNGICRSVKHTHINGPRAARLPNNVNISFADVVGESLVLALNVLGIETSTGSACSSAADEPSHVLLALGQEPRLAHGSLRLTLGKSTTEEAVDHVVRVLAQTVAQLRDQTISTSGSKK